MSTTQNPPDKDGNATHQLEGVLSRMFGLVEHEVEPFVDSNTAVSLRSYRSLTLNLIKSMDAQRRPPRA